MTRLYIFLIVLWLGTSHSLAIDLFKKKTSEQVNYTEWRDTARLAQFSEAGLPLFYPDTDSEGRAVVSGTIDLPGCSAAQIFLGALDYVTDNLEIEDYQGQIEVIKESDYCFSFEMCSRKGSTNTETIYFWRGTIRAEQGRLLFSVSDIEVKFRDKVILPRKMAFEKLKPDTNARHRELVELFAALLSDYMHLLAKTASVSPYKSIAHWDEVHQKKVVEGMTPLEVKLILGRPAATRDNGTRIRWVYPGNYIVLYENGVVSRVIE